ncbi:MAG: AarF/UbiB family protein, partial [Actinomycetota bacterium]|nr:AarF/UbiB family protein [Actinomycetota bacterium]
MPSSSQTPPPPDLALGSFSDAAPWIVEIDHLAWLPGVDSLRIRNRASVPRLIAPRRSPQTLRAFTVAWAIGRSLAAWRLIDRPKGNPASRIGLSRRLKQTFERLGPTYIKLGQIISSGDGIFPEELVREFKELRDRVKPEPFAVVRATVEEELGAELEEIFSEFDTDSIAAASIAQVHLARLRTGEEVVVKVQRSAVSELVAKDLAAMSWIAPALVGRIPVAALANPPALVELFAETITEELDFRLEAANMLDVARLD